MVTGSRVSGMKAVESSSPVQILDASELESAGRPDLMNALANTVPSFTAQAFGGDMANQTLQAKLRGLSPNHVLVLVNGKRRHTTASLAVLGGPYQGGAGVDLNFIPVESIDHLEVLTEGAAAQYGTDAIAGVINIKLEEGRFRQRRQLHAWRLLCRRRRYRFRLRQHRIRTVGRFVSKPLGRDAEACAYRSWWHRSTRGEAVKCRS